MKLLSQLIATYSALKAENLVWIIMNSMPHKHPWKASSDKNWKDENKNTCIQKKKYYVCISRSRYYYYTYNYYISFIVLAEMGFHNSCLQ